MTDLVKEWPKQKGGANTKGKNKQSMSDFVSQRLRKSSIKTFNSG